MASEQACWRRGLYDSGMNPSQALFVAAKSDQRVTVPLTVSGSTTLASTGLRMPQLTIEWE